MDRRALEYTRAHYDKHSNQYASTAEALQARAQGPGAPLKKFHNTIKRQLINRFATGADSLLDFACGRGGDIWKWIDAGITKVMGVDLSPGEIDEAKKRFAEAQAKRPNQQLDYQFVDTPSLGLEEWREPAQYDVVTCMFAIHYFFVSEAALKQFLHNVSINLKDGGYFIGTVPDGKRVNACIKHGKKLELPMLTIEAHWQGTPGCFGSPYICAIGDTVTGGEKGTQGSYEYLVYSNVLVGVAAQYGLRPVLDYGDPALAELFEVADAAKPLKHFQPHFPDSDKSLETASSLFAAFVFQKTSGTPVAPSPSAAPRYAAQEAGSKRGREDAAPAAAPQQRPAQRRRPGLMKPAAQQQAQQQQGQQDQRQQQDGAAEGAAAERQQAEPGDEAVQQQAERAEGSGEPRQQQQEAADGNT
ncbi:hypothetical protein ABPG77_008477 [Micractinium sp. CCAP 211/92]